MLTSDDYQLGVKLPLRGENDGANLTYFQSVLRVMKQGHYLLQTGRNCEHRKEDGSSNKSIKKHTRQSKLNADKVFTLYGQLSLYSA